MAIGLTKAEAAVVVSRQRIGRPSATPLVTEDAFTELADQALVHAMDLSREISKENIAAQLPSSSVFLLVACSAISRRIAEENRVSRQTEGIERFPIGLRSLEAERCRFKIGVAVGEIARTGGDMREVLNVQGCLKREDFEVTIHHRRYGKIEAVIDRHEMCP
jgi:hypothetical protein